MFIGHRSFRQVRGHVAAVTVEGCVIEIRFVGNLHVRIIFEKVDGRGVVAFGVEHRVFDRVYVIG